MLDGLLIARAIHSAMDRAQSSSASILARSAKGQTEKLEAEVNKLSMVVEALWMLLKEQHGYSDEDLIAKIAEVDMRDGKYDGRVSVKSGPRECPSCGRTLSKRMANCMYCGQPIEWEPFER